MFTLGFRSSSGSHLLHNGLAAGGFSYAPVDFTDGLVIKLALSIIFSFSPSDLSSVYILK